MKRIYSTAVQISTIVFTTALILTLSILLLVPGTSMGQANISGRVLDQDEDPVVNAYLLLEDTRFVTNSDFEGNFRFDNIPAGEYRLKVSHLAFETKFSELRVGDSDQSLTIDLEGKSYTKDPVRISATRASEEAPFSFSGLSREEIAAQNTGRDLPYVMMGTPSAVITSDAGNGIGYTGIRIRGSDPTRTNVTINGIPLNDPESQGVFWVNLPDFASSTESIQVQRGVGTSTNGAGAFGASINIETGNIEQDPYVEIANNYGSFNSMKNNITLGSGLLRDHWHFSGRLSRISSDGFIDRARTDLLSFFTSGAFVSSRSSVKLNIFSGWEETYQAWDGVPGDTLLAGNRTYNQNGTDGGQLDPPYDNEIDRYNQTHYQFIYDQVLTKDLGVQMAIHYTRGKGFFEQYKVGQDLNDYGISPDTISTSDDTLILDNSDLIRRRWLDNHFYGFTYALNYDDLRKLKLTLGGALNYYLGGHFGEVIWARYAGDSRIRDRYYDNEAEKTDYNVFMQATWSVLPGLKLFGDVQFRYVNYDFLGLLDNGEAAPRNVDHKFFNPKVGITYRPVSGQEVYFSFAVGNKEPNRDDYTESAPGNSPTAERLYNYELGYRFQKGDFPLQASANVYYMDYRDQLILTGKLNDVGAYTRVNVPESYRLGLELQASLALTSWFNWSSNLTLSRNKIREIDVYIDNFDTWEQEIQSYENTDLAFSPGIIFNNELRFELLPENSNDSPVVEGLSLTLRSQYVGRQYLDNSSSTQRSLDPWFNNDLALEFKVKAKIFEELMLNFHLFNVLNAEYESNGWTYVYSEGGEMQQLLGFYPQAGIHFMAGVNIRF